ncbi:MAG: hypothetical protein ACK5S6_02450 [bacterium]|jgi:hypothetical protein
MGMFDEIRCKMPLPVEIDVEHREHWFQTKSLGCDMDYYEIREDGTLWREAYETEDRSDPNANKQWIPCLAFTGEIAFYTQASSIAAKDVGQSHSGWIEFSTYFVRGELKQFELMRYDMPSSC